MQQNRGNLKEKLVFVFFKMDFSENLPLEDVYQRIYRGLVMGADVTIKSHKNKKDRLIYRHCHCNYFFSSCHLDLPSAFILCPTSNFYFVYQINIC